MFKIRTIENHSIYTMKFDNNTPKHGVVYLCKKWDDEKNIGFYHDHVGCSFADNGSV